MEQAKFFGAFLNGIMKREYEGDASITPEYLKEAIFSEFPEVTVEKIVEMYNYMKELIALAAHEDYDPSQIDTFLKLKKTTLTQTQKEAFSKFWRSHRGQIHDVVCQRAIWDNTFDRVAWRIDVKTRTKESLAEGVELNDPVAIYELHINLAGDQKKKDVARFEMDKEQLKEVLAQVTSIEKDIQAAAGGNADK